MHFSTNFKATLQDGNEIGLYNFVESLRTLLIGIQNLNAQYGRFPFDQIFRFEILGIPCDKRNSIFRFIGLTNPMSSGSKFHAKIRDQTEDSFTFVICFGVARRL